MSLNDEEQRRQRHKRQEDKLLGAIASRDPQPLPAETNTEWLRRRNTPGLFMLVATLEDMSQLDELAGPVDATNPLKWAVYRALMNGNGNPVRIYIGTTPDPLS